MAALGTGGPPAARGLPWLLLLLAVASIAFSSPAAAQQQAWTVVTDPDAAGTGVEMTRVSGAQRPFSRPPPRTLDPQLLSDFLPAFSLLQDVSPTGDNTFTDVQDQYVATIHSGFVEGEAGLVYDAAACAYHLPNLFFTRVNPLLPLPQRSVAEAAASCEWYSGLATVVQRYGHMYYHFVEEALPRVALLMASGRLTSDVKLLTWGQPYEAEYLEMLGVSRSQLVTYNASKVYCADRLLVPTPTPRITPPREGLQLVRQGLGVATLPEAQRDLLIYVSRQGESTRRVANEQALLQAIRAAFPQQQLVVYSGGLAAADTIALFQRARVVLGPHGAGLSHILFAAPGTTVIEFLFMADPPLMFWHTAAALGQPYWLLPVPHAYWMQEEMQVPADEVLDILTAVLTTPPPSPPACIPGTYTDTAASDDGSRRCIACTPGSYAANVGSKACKPCAAGRLAAAVGAAACRTCKPGTFSAADGRSCLACPEGTFSVLPGAWSVEQCLTPEQRRRQQEDEAASVLLLSKLSPVFADQRRRLVEQGVPPAALTQAQLCAAQGDVYSGPYLLGGRTNCTSLPVAPVPAYPELIGSPPPLIVITSPSLPPAPVPAPAPLVLPPIDVPTLPPALAANSPPPPSPSPSSLGAPAPAPAVAEVKAADVAQVSPPPPPPATQLYPEPGKVVDSWVIILACVLGGLVALPLLAWLLRRCILARQHRKSRAAAAATGPLGSQPYSYANPTFQPAARGSAAGDAEQAPLAMM
ncbi:hypothetical protein D9Q98_003081 [Chlorella vulgaris]|uniref:Uncharacterized protein n=1 Tax=Chlorella vulgaris TaxID=3077 RepID=A0A9D4TUZ3_CHLVU|nr:hypothetical protein D9Q98_003081 [Chlorella vulgaris]